ncbi:MFS transporter [Catenulispora pinisilvae]|uniref:MFS transporter n=1 Tax=Catenulispora pinisilvae TaxID=2705253 RepID=UPI0018928590|nr:MFS transporter [Catenulispora pinisilvae]
MTDMTAPQAAPVRLDRGRLILVVVASAQLMTALDATIVNIALPSAQHALGFGDAQRQWVVTAYTVCFAGLLLFGGRVADLFGRRRSFQLGLAGFGLSSLLAGLAPTLPVLAAGRALQGAFAALITPSVLSLLAVTFTGPRERARAFAVYGAVASSGAAAGLLLGGVITEYLGWRWCLFVNVVLAGVVLMAGRAVLPDQPASTRGGLHPGSAVLATGGLAAVVLGCGQAARDGWSSPFVLSALIGGVLLLGIFAWRQRQAPDPMLPLRILADRHRVGACLAVGTAVIGAFGMFLMLTYHLQEVLHYSPARAGAAVLPMALANAVSGYQLGNRLTLRVAPRYLIAGGLLVAAAGLFLMTRLTPASGYLVPILPAEILVGTGMGMLFPPAFQLAIRGVTQRDAGITSAVANAATQVGSSVGTAVLNSLAVSATAAYLLSHPSSASGHQAALVHGYATATGWAAALLALMAVGLFLLLRTATSIATATATAIATATATKEI